MEKALVRRKEPWAIVEVNRTFVAVVIHMKVAQVTRNNEIMKPWYFASGCDDGFFRNKNGLEGLPDAFFGLIGQDDKRFDICKKTLVIMLHWF